MSTLLPEPQDFHLLSGAKNATLTKLLWESNAMADVKSLSMFFPALHKKPFIQQCPIHQQSHSMEAWREFGKPLAGDYFMFGLLVPASNVTWQVSTQPCSYQSQLTDINSYTTCLRLSTPIFPTALHFTLIFTALTMAYRAWGCPEQVSCQLKRSSSSSFWRELLSWSDWCFPSWTMSNKSSIREKGTWCLWISTVFPLFVFSWVNVHSIIPDVLDTKLEAGRVEIT